MVDTTSNKVVIDQGGTVLWNGQAVDLPTMSDALTRASALASPELHLEPDALAPYQRVDEVLAVTKRVGVEKMGFVGNEKYREF